MNENELARELRRYLDGFGPYDRRHSASVFEELPERRSQARRRRALALVACLLGLALAGTLLLSGHRPAGAPAPAVRPSPRPSAPAAPTVEPTPAAGALPAGDLDAAGLADVAGLGLVQKVDVTAQVGDQTGHLVGVYADPVRTVFLLDGLTAAGPPNGPILSYTLFQGGDLFRGGLRSGTTPDGVYVSFDGGITPGTDGTASVTLQVAEVALSGSSGPAAPPATGSFAVQVRVLTAVTSPKAPSSLVVGGRTYHVASLLETPDMIGVVLEVDNARVEDVTGSPPSRVPAPLTLTDPSGSSLSPVNMSAGLAGSGVQVRGSWVRGPAGTYRLTVSGPGGAQNSFQFDVS